MDVMSSSTLYDKLSNPSMINMGTVSVYTSSVLHMYVWQLYIEVNILHHVILEKVSTTANILPYKY
jgi:hypothetical protein